MVRGFFQIEKVKRFIKLSQNLRKSLLLSSQNMLGVHFKFGKVFFWMHDECHFFKFVYIFKRHVKILFFRLMNDCQKDSFSIFEKFEKSWRDFFLEKNPDPPSSPLRWEIFLLPGLGDKP